LMVMPLFMAEFARLCKWNERSSTEHFSGGVTAKPAAAVRRICEDGKYLESL
jgi:hypothetical protein